MSICCGNSWVGTSGINGDRFYISSDKTTLVLSDGASGAGREGKVMMSKCCVESIENNPFLNSGLTAKEYLDKMIWKINNDLIRISQENNNYIFGTLIICIIYDDVITLASVGDSPAYFIRDNNIKRIFKPKKTYQNLI